MTPLRVTGAAACRDKRAKIRQIDADERPELSLPVQACGFQPSPASPAEMSRPRGNRRYFRDDITADLGRTAERGSPAGLYDGDRDTIGQLLGPRAAGAAGLIAVGRPLITEIYC
jgi:hypothetical protein